MFMMVINFQKIKKSIAFRALLQPQDKTFNDQEIEELSKKIIDEISKSLNASIRN